VRAEESDGNAQYGNRRGFHSCTTCVRVCKVVCTRACNNAHLCVRGGGKFMSKRTGLVVCARYCEIVHVCVFDSVCVSVCVCGFRVVSTHGDPSYDIRAVPGSGRGCYLLHWGVRVVRIVLGSQLHENNAVNTNGERARVCERPGNSRKMINTINVQKVRCAVRVFVRV
jgi:hypothetical protein